MQKSGPRDPERTNRRCNIRPIFGLHSSPSGTKAGLSRLHSVVDQTMGVPLIAQASSDRTGQKHRCAPRRRGAGRDAHQCWVPGLFLNKTADTRCLAVWRWRGADAVGSCGGPVRLPWGESRPPRPPDLQPQAFLRGAPGTQQGESGAQR